MNYGVTLNNESARPLLAGRYRIVRQLGQGGMGSVWLAEDTKLDGKLFALKMLPSILVSDKRAYQQLKNEALVSMKLVHSNIVQIRAFEDNNNNPFLVMDYIEGQTLNDWLGNGELGMGNGEGEVVRLLKPIAEALDYAHSKGVVHRDVKPGNIIVAEDGTPYVLDFGIAREIQETMKRVTGAMSSGTIMYMSPEQFHGLDPDKFQDIYSFAAMVYECLTGKPPFYRGQIEHQIDHDEPAPPSGDIAIASSVMAGLAKKPDDRPKSCVAVLEGAYGKREKDLELGVRSQELGEGVCERPREPRRKFFVKFAAIGFLASGLIGGVCALLGKKESNDKFEVIEDGMVQLWEGGPYWAAKNIGADKPEDPGYYFWWGDTVGYEREGGCWDASDGSKFNFSFSNYNTPTFGKSILELKREGWIEKKNGTYTLTSKHDAAQAHLGGAWRMPTKDEFYDLRSKCDWTLTRRNGNGGYVVRGKGRYASKSIFLPFAGYGDGSSLNGAYYWSSVPSSYRDGAWCLYFNPHGHFTYISDRYCGQCIRPLQGFTK